MSLTLIGELEKVDVHTQRLGGDRGKMVALDLSDLSKFRFPGDEDPRNGVNRSEWDKKVFIDKKANKRGLDVYTAAIPTMAV